MRQRLQNPRGQSLIELQAGIIILIPALFVLLDLSLIFLGVQQNDAVCRNAARAAACGDPREARCRAQAVLTRMQAQDSGPFVSQYELVEPVDLKITSAPAKQVDPRTGKEVSPGGPVLGTATVSTEVKVRPFVVHMVWTGKAPIIFRSTHSFPLSYVMPPG